MKVLLERLSIDYKEVALSDDRFSDALAYEANGETLVRIGKVAPAMLKDFDIDQDCFYAEIELELAQKLRFSKELKFNDISINEIIENIKQDECKEISNQFLNSISAYFVRFYTKDKDVEKLINEINNGS